MNREQIESVADSLKVGQAVRYDRHQIAEAYPPIGMNDFKSLALARAGNRPEPRMTTEDRVRQFCARHGLAPTFNPMDGSVTICPKLARCTACRGSGKVQRQQRHISLTFSTAVAKIVLADCEACASTGHVRIPCDPEARFGDHSDSDAWIARRRKQREVKAPPAPRKGNPMTYWLATNAPQKAEPEDDGA